MSSIPFVRRIGGAAPAAALAVVLAALVGCAGGSSPPGPETSARSSGAEITVPRDMVPPASSKLAQVKPGMAPADVRSMVGEPTSEQSYITGKAWIPFYYGSDTQRTDWKYAGKGRVVFGHNRWSGSMKVIRVDYDPSEDGA